LEILYVDYNLIQLHLEKNLDGNTFVRCETLPRTNVTPQNGRFYIDYTIEDKFVEYRNLKEYGVYLLEFDSGKRGLINKAIPHFLMKNFAQSCWAELCEIYGIPPRWIKTNTQDKQMLDRAETMMRDFGAAAWWIIDSTEEFGFAQNAINATGDVYKNLINLCNNEMSLLVSGAIIGQDTANGNRSKDESSREVLMERVEQDLRFAAEQWNRVVLPALKRLGMIKGELEFRYVVPEDKDALWKKVVDALPYYDVEPEWVEEKFGIKVSKKANPVAGGNLGIAQSFFD
jgi:phage gp29-like protein